MHYNADNLKFSVPPPRDSGEIPDRRFVYPNIFDIEKTTGPERMILAPSDDHVGLLRELASALAEPFGVLYVLLLSRRGEATPGRYQVEDPVERVVLDSFLEEFHEFFEGDGRHHLWIMSRDGVTLVYDHHNVIYAYGPLDRFRAIAEARGMRQGEVRYPTPHGHHYNERFDDDERRVLSHWRWKWFPLQPQDDPHLT